MNRSKSHRITNSRISHPQSNERFSQSFLIHANAKKRNFARPFRLVYLRDIWRCLLFILVIVLLALPVWRYFENCSCAAYKNENARAREAVLTANNARYERDKSRIRAFSALRPDKLWKRKQNETTERKKRRSKSAKVIIAGCGQAALWKYCVSREINPWVNGDDHFHYLWKTICWLHKFAQSISCTCMKFFFTSPPI